MSNGFELNAFNMNKRFEKFGVAAREYSSAHEAATDTYGMPDDRALEGQIFSTNLTFPDNPFNDDIINAKTIFEIGFGVGRNVKWIMENTNADYYGVEPNESMYTHFWKFNENEKYKDRIFLHDNFDAMPKGLHFDVVLSTYVFQHIGYMPPAHVHNISDITNSILNYTKKDTVWLLIEHDGEDNWIPRWFQTHNITPQVYERGYEGQPDWCHRDWCVGNKQGHHLIIWKQQ